MDRIERLRALIQKNPEDAFPRYGLAMEYRNRSQHQQAVELFEELLAAQPDYGPAYYHLGMSLVVMGEQQRARETFERGIQLADKKGDTHARDELVAALAELDPENP